MKSDKLFIPFINQKQLLKKHTITITSIQVLKWILYLSNQKTISKPHVLILNLTDKINLRRVEKSVALSNLSIHYIWKNIKS